MTARIQLHDIRKAFGPTEVLRGISCAFEAGAVTAVLGANGAGKSTLLKICGGVLGPTSGVVRAGEPLRPVRNVRGALAAGVRFIHQEGSLVPAWTVAEHFGGAGREAWALLAPHIAAAMPTGRLNTHDRQLIEVARALHGSPSVVLADEPTAGLAPAERDLVFSRLRAAASAGAAVVMVTHDLDAAAAVADRLVMLRGGVVAADGAPSALSRADVLQAMGVAVGETAARRSGEGAGDVRMRILPRPGAEAIDLISGVVTGMIGGPFSGAAEAVRAASGLPAVGGDGRTGRRDPKLAYMSREPSEWDFPGLPLSANLNMATLPAQSNLGWLGLGRLAAQAQALRQAYRVTAPSLDHPVEQLSGGNRQKAVLARLAAARPQVLLLDEPFSGVDAPTRLALGEELRRLAAEGMAIGVYSQELADLAAACDRVVVAGDDGRIAILESEGATPALIEAVLAEHAISTNHEPTAA